MMPSFVLAWFVLFSGMAEDPPGAAAVAQNAADVEDGEALHLSFPDAIGLALRHNLALAGARLETEAAWAGYGGTWGIFDTSTFVNFTRREHITAPTPNNVVGGVNLGGSPSTEVDLLTWRAGLTGTLSTGTTWTFGIGPRRTRFQSQTMRSESNVADWRLELSHPLLRGGADEYVWSGIRLAAQDVLIAATDGESAASQVLVTVITSYWNLLFARQNLATKERSVDLAQELLGITLRKRDQGLQNRLDVIEAEAEVARRAEELLTARNALEQAMDDLRVAVFGPEAGGTWHRPIVPTTGYQEASEGFLGSINPERVSVEESLALALEYRPDLRSAQLAVERARLARERAETEALPRFDVSAAYGLNSNARRSWRALRDLDDTSFHEAQLVLDFSMPIGNRSAGYVVRQRDLEEQRAGVALTERLLATEAEVRGAVRRLALDKQRIVSSAETRRLREEAYEGERRRLENDLSTPFKVREAQRDFLESLDNEVRAQLDLAISWTSLLQVQGRLPYVFGYRPSSLSLSEDDPPPAP